MAEKTRYAGKWLTFREVSFTNTAGESREWEYVARTGSGGAVSILAIQEGAVPRIILLRQFRPPLESDSLEFPAGLLEPGESIQSATLRELEEETGFTGDIVHIGPPIYSSPGLTDEYVSLVTVRITGQTRPRLEADESIEVFLLPLPDLMNAVQRFQAEGVLIEAKLWSFAQGLNWGLTGLALPWESADKGEF